MSFQRHVYVNVKDYQLLQRQRDTNTAWVKNNQGQLVELKVGGPYTIDGAYNVFVGDLWVLAGQSNMRGYGFFDDTNDKNNKAAVFRSNETWGPLEQPIHQLASSPRAIHHCLPDPTVRDPSLAFIRGTSLAPSFADHYSQQVGVPVGFIPCAHGGVTIQQWTEDLYNVMLDKIQLVGGHITGVLWYQGESDAVDLVLAQQYKDAWTRWIKQLGQDTLLVYCQIGRMVTDDNDMDQAWNMVRKAQLDVFCQHHHSLPLAIVSTLDADMDDFIHLSANGLRNIGRRLAEAAVGLIQHKDIPPLYGTQTTMLHSPYGSSSSKLAVHLLRLALNQPIDGNQVHSNITGFSIHDTHQHAQMDIIYSVRINKDGYIDLYLTEKGYQQLTRDEGRYVLWYGYGRNPQCNLITTSNNVAALAFGPLSIVVT
ncbi:SGNH hydrolase-type esterase domain-containing protein [Chlamydoabsidia padenii]|nr:SGNH hydrolase-type esterase domain-containing protein [Chlamydoabsidia padenii]